MISKKIVTVILITSLVIAVIVLAYILGYKKAEEDIYKQQQEIESHIKNMFDPSKLSKEEQEALKQAKLDIEKMTNEFLEKLGEDVKED